MTWTREHTYRTLRSFLARPFSDVLNGLERCLADDARGYRELGLVGLGLVAGWWIYVPLHELAHAFGCLAAGGSVSRLEIDPLYFGTLLEGLVPFVVAGGEYAGHLSGFDTHGSDAVYLTTVLAPFVLALFPGVWALRRAARSGSATPFGFFLPFALAPFLSLTGDAYEFGSILVTRLPPWSDPGLREALRGDDVVRLAQELAAHGGIPWGGFATAFAVGALWAFATYAVASALADALGEKSVEPLAG